MSAPSEFCGRCNEYSCQGECIVVSKSPINPVVRHLSDLRIHDYYTTIRCINNKCDAGVGNYMDPSWKICPYCGHPLTDIHIRTAMHMLQEIIENVPRMNFTDHGAYALYEKVKEFRSTFVWR